MIGITTHHHSVPFLKAALDRVFQNPSYEECMRMMSLRDFFLESGDYSLHGH